MAAPNAPIDVMLVGCPPVANAVVVIPDTTGDSINELVIERKTGSGSYEEVKTLSFESSGLNLLPSNASIWFDDGLQAGETYQYRAKAVNGDGDSSYTQSSSEVLASTNPIGKHVVHTTSSDGVTETTLSLVPSGGVPGLMLSASDVGCGGLLSVAAQITASPDTGSVFPIPIVSSFVPGSEYVLLVTFGNMATVVTRGV